MESSTSAFTAADSDGFPTLAKGETEYDLDFRIMKHYKIWIHPVTGYIDIKFCDPESEDTFTKIKSMGEKTPKLLVKYLQGCDRATSFKRAEDDIKYAYVSTLFTVLLMLVGMAIFILNVGFQNALKTVFYVISFHWLIKQIANSKEGNSIKVQFKKSV